MGMFGKKVKEELNAIWAEQWLSMLEELKQRRKQVSLGGGPKAIERQHKKGKMTARERVEYLLDEDKPHFEIGTFAGWEMYEEWGGCPSGGTVVVLGYVSGRQCVIVAHDATVKAGAFFPITIKKNLRAQEIAIENRLPIIYLVDSAGVFLPMQDEVFPDKEHFGRMFYNNSRMSAMGIPQIAAIMGSCVAGGAYLPILSDEALIVEKTGSVFLAGPYLVRAAIGEITDEETLGGATTHTEISGVTDYKCKDDKDCLDRIKAIMDKLGPFSKAGFNREDPVPPARRPEEIYGLLPPDPTMQYDMYKVLETIVDEGSFEEYKKGYGPTIITGYARIDGWAVGIVANQRLVVKTRKGEMQVGGVIYSDSADKAARFIMNCNQKRIPIVFLQDVTGFMVGTKAEHGGIIKDGAKMVNVVSNSIVPKITVVLGNSFGAGNYAMCGRAYDPRLMLATPSARIAVMGGEQAAKTLLQIRKNQLKKAGKELSPEEEEKLLNEIKEKYNKQMSPYYAAARLWIDEIIDPAKLREWISFTIEMANNKPITEEFKTGVIQV